MSEQLEEQQASPELQKFFENLLGLKAHVLAKAEETENAIIKDIHDRLDSIIKEKK